MMDFNANLSKLRIEIEKLGVDAILISMHNFFGNFKSEVSGIQYVSGFSGSNGRAVVSKDRAILSVDGRYQKQAKEQTNEALWQVEMYPEFNTTKMVTSILSKGQTLAVAYFSATYQSYLSLLKLSKSAGINIKLIDSYPLPSFEKSESNIYLINEKHTGEQRKSRINKVKQTLKNGESVIISDPATVGWFFGVRVPPSEDKCVLPNCVAFIQKEERPILFCDLKLDVMTNDFEFVDISKFEDVIKIQKKSGVNMDLSRTPTYFPMILQNNDFFVKPQEVDYGKFEAIKNDTEIENQKKAAELTSLSFIKTLAFAEIVKSSTEIDIAEFFENDIKRCDNFVSLSFNSISSFEKSTSFVHYNPKSCGNAIIDSDGLFLFDAGAHFNNSTTDMTRVIYRGQNPDKKLIEIYSIVLKAIIMFSSMKFPDKTKACYLDSIARFFIWSKGHDYPFGTGHGVGSFANVHEHPRISPNSVEEITNNMVITVEPGIYLEDFGIRLENMLLTKESSKIGFVEFETLNYIPFCEKLIDKSMLSNFELKWINHYHQKVYDKFSERFKGDECTLEWLKANTKEI
ncbi:MAG: M24 family metallopeptidase [Holosporales bacterium]|jgi:Xaa-Pro aminopeptidase|nr:M24 family metallopeptidase [Holosporales bacterium]